MPRTWVADDEYEIIRDLLDRQRGHAAAIAAVQMPQPAKDTFTVASTPATTYTLTAIPYVGTGGSSLNLSLNGVELVEGVDYTVDYTTAVVTVSATLKGTPTPADVLTADYWTTGDLIALSGPADVGLSPAGYISTASAGNSGVTSLTSPMPPGFAANDMLLAALIANVTPTTPAGWTLINNNGLLYIYTRTATGSETGVTWSLGGSGAAQSKIRAYRGPSSVSVNAHGIGAGLTSPSVTATGAFTQVTVFAAQQSFTTSSITADPAMTNTDGGGNTVTYMICGDETMTAGGATPTRTGTIGAGSMIDYESATIVLAGL